MGEPEIRKTKVVIKRTRGIEWTRFRHAHGTSEFHAAEQHVELECDVAVQIDWDGLLTRLGGSAAFNKGGKSSLAHGLIQLRVLGKKVLKDERKPSRIPDGYVKVEKDAA